MTHRPNFVFVMTDTQGANMVGCYGRSGLHTPHLDALAADGVRFDRAYTTSPLCSPARSALFTGLYPSVNGVHTNNLAPGDNIVHMGRRFSDLGYHAAYIGKWHLDGLDYFDSGICPQGWDDEYWFDGRRYLASLADDQVELWRSGLDTIDSLERHHIGAEFTWAHQNSTRAVRFLERHGPDDQPFLLVVSYDEPHGPSTCPPEYAKRFKDFAWDVGPAAFDSLEHKPQHQRDWAGQVDPGKSATVNQPLFFGCNSFVDSQIGRVIKAAKRIPNTWIIYTSDHGDQLGAHRLFGKGPCMYEETCRIPLIVRPPGGLPDGAAVDGCVSHIDLLPTMLHLAGAEVPPIFTGQVIADQFHGGAGDSDRAVTMEFTRYAIVHDGWGGFQPIRAVVRGTHKLVINLLHTDELYDLADDPHEMDNRIDDPALVSIRNDLHDELLRQLDQMRDPFRGPAWCHRPWRTDRHMPFHGGYRHRPPDGYAPPTLAYWTGHPPKTMVD